MASDLLKLNIIISGVLIKWIAPWIQRILIGYHPINPYLNETYYGILFSDRPREPTTTLIQYSYYGKSCFSFSKIYQPFQQSPTNQKHQIIKITNPESIENHLFSKRSIRLFIISAWGERRTLYGSFSIDLSHKQATT